ncbi:MAG: hypothetical protein FJ271_02265 [Planctomycetes bacterium]|nr:hypothetical protein [Planctomycetota bacterium]
MLLDYVPLLQVQRDLHDTPRDAWVNGKPKRFTRYLRTLASSGGLELPPLVAVNPMAKDHVRSALDDLLAMDADGIAARTLAEAASLLREVPGNFKVTLVVVDDWGGWGNRCCHEFAYRFPAGIPSKTPRWTRHLWLSAFVWGSESASARLVRDAILTMVHRLAYVHGHGPARTLLEMLAQEGQVMARAGCVQPTLDADDIAYTREVLTPYLDTDDKRTCMECLFGDEAARTLGFTPRGLSPWAGLALALHDGKANVATSERA